jgi:predicted DNA-binding protein
MSKKRLTIWLPDDLRSRIESERKQMERTLSEYARIIFEAHFKELDAFLATSTPKEVKKR